MAINPVKARGQVSLAKLYDGTNGKDGKDGAQGVPGAPGADGKTTYVHVAYADSADGKTNFSITDPTDRKYIGVLTDFSINDSTDYRLYTWSLAQGPIGPTGSTGAPGPKGADGLTTYVHVAYANSADGKTDFSTTDPVGKSYIGVLTDTTPEDSTDYTKYTWSLVRGSDGAQGPQGVQGPKGADGKTTYVHFAYANSADGSKDFSTTETTGRNYIGVFTDNNINDSTNYADYTWSLVQGPTGPTGNTGAVGPKGADGRTTYVHVAYADSANGSTNFSTTDPTNRKYIGVLTDFNINDSTTPGDYTWSLAQGPTGPTGNTGATGAKGADGRTTYVHVAYANSDNGASSFSTTDPTGRAYIGVLTDFNINDSTNYADYTWSLAKGADGANGAQGVQGPKGADGRTTYVHFAYANSADGTSNFSIDDPTGRAYIGTYTDFTLNDSTKPSDYTWSLVKGADGANGAQGIQGPKGTDGRNTYVHFAYAGNATGTTNFSTTDPTGRAYIGVLTDFNLNDSTTPSDYTWSLAQGPTGPTGANGATGPKGADGKTTYVHIAYASNATGTSNFSTTDPTGRTYIGVLTDTNLPDSTNPADYSWSLIKGADGAQGPQGIQGPVGANGKNTYVHFAYANSANGATSFSTTDPTGRAYIGVLTDFNLNDSTNYADYTWSLAKGADGAQGIQGPVGPDGRTSYVHFAYATSANGSTGFSTTDPTGASYIGTYTDFTINDSTDYKSYTWSRMKGDTGNGIANTVIEYQITNTQDQPSDTSGWTTTIPNIGAGVYLWTRTTFVYTDGTKSRTYTVSRQSDNVYTAVLTNDSITLPADASGNVTDFSGSNGQFIVYDGAYQVDPTKVTIQVAQQVNVTVATGGSNYSITAMDKTKDSGYFDLSYTYKGVLLTKRVSVSKSKRGTDGSNPVIVNLSATSQVFTFDSNNKPYPVNQNINFSTTVSGTSATPVYTAIPYTDTGIAGTAIVLGAYGTNGKQLQVAQLGNYQRVVVMVTAGGGTDSTTIVRVKDGSSVSPIPDPSNTVSSATPPTNPKEGDWWNDTSQTPNVLKYRYRDKWVQYELDGYYVKANSISGEAIVTNTLEAQKIKYTNSDGTTTNLQTFDLKGMQTVMTDASGHTYTSMDNAVSSTQTWQGLNTKVNSLGQINQLFNTEFTPDFAGWVSGDSPLGKWDPSTSVLLQNDSGWALGDGKHSGSNVLKKSFVSGSRSQFSSLPIPVGAGQAVAGSIQAQSTTSYDGNVTARIDFRYYDSTMNYISMDSVSSGKLLRWTTVQMARTTPANTAYIVYVLLTNGTTGNNYYSQPMLTFSSVVGNYVQGNYNNNQSVAQIKAQADNIELSVSNMAVGGRNYILDTGNPKTQQGGGKDNQDAFNLANFSSPIKNWGTANADYTVSFDWKLTNALTAPMVLGVFFNQSPWQATYNTIPAGQTSGHISYTFKLNAGILTATPDITGLTFRVNSQLATGNSITYSRLKFEQGNMPTDWTEAPEDVATWTQAQIKVAADNINIGVSSAQKAADAATNKVNSLSVGGTNLLLGTKGFTGNSLNNPWSFGGGYTFTTDGPSILTAHSNSGQWGGPKYAIRDLIKRGVVNSTDTYVMSAWMKNTSSSPIIIGFYHSTSTISLTPNTDVSATLPANSGWVRVVSPLISISDSALTTITTQSFRFEPKTATTGGAILQAGLKLEKGNMPTDWSPAPEDVPQVNQAYNTEFTSNTDGWDRSPYMNLDTSTGIVTYNRTDLTGTTANWQVFQQLPSLAMPVKAGDPISASVFIISSPVKGTLPVSDHINMAIEFLDASGNRNYINTTDIANLTNSRVLLSNIIAPAGAVSARFRIETNGNTSFSFKQPMLVKSYTVGDYTPGFSYSGIQGGRNYVLASSGVNAMDSSRPVLSGSWTEARTGIASYQPDGITLTNPTTNKTVEWFYQVAGAMTPITNIPLNPGQTFTFSADVMGTVPQAVLRWGFQGTGGSESFQAFKITNPTTWQRISVTLTIPTGATGMYLRIQGGINGQYQTGWAGGETLRFRNVKVEDGSVATAWSPAPEDLVTTANSASYRYLRFNGQGNNVNDGVHFTQIEALTNKGVNVMSGLSATLWGSGTGTIRIGTNSSATNGDFTNNTYLELVNIVNQNQFAVYDLGSQRFDLDKLRMTMWGPDRIYYGVLAQASADGVNWTTIFKGNIDNTTLYNGIVSATVSFGTSLAPVQAAQATATTANGTANSAQSAAKAVTDKVNSLSVGGRNLLLDTATRTAVGQNGTNKTPDTFKWTLAGGLNVGDLYTTWGNNAPISLSFDWSITGTTIAGVFSPQWSGTPWAIGAPNVPRVTVSSTSTSGHYVSSTFTASGWSGSTANQFTLRTDNLQGTLTITNLKFEQGNLPTAWSPAPEDVDGAIKKVSNDLKLTVDGYSLGTTVDGKLVSGFTGNQQQVTIKGNMVNLDANTVVGNNFILQSANIGDLTAGKIKTGSIVGNNLNINLDTGAVLFQKGRIYSQGKEVDINIDQNYIRSLGKFGSISLENGAIYLSGPVYDKPIITDGPSIDLYLSISSVLMPSLDSQPDGYIGAAFLAKDFMKIGLRDFPIAEWIPGETSNNLGTIISRQTGTAIYGKDIGVNIAGGSVLNHPGGISFKTPRIAVGFNPTKDPTSMSTNPGDDLRSGGILLSADSVVLADASGTHGSITRDGIKTNNYTRYVTAENDTYNLPLVMGLERIGNIVMVSFNFITYGSTIQADQIQMNGPKIPVGFRPVDNVHIQAHANVSGTTIGTITFTITPEGKILQTSPAINGRARVMGSGFYLTYSVSPSVGTKMDGSTGNTTA